eukprot:TRINITY_DN13645_c0_g1_i1.p2 TRINITY_DN13645_c0_g1~~TRINITY_DN13645_c0_g1_i1.p2  ORF type:complete len:115 (+),score=50.73 TRINITY_DN13645_c0_g1_i1:109-453(+)
MFKQTILSILPGQPCLLTPLPSKEEQERGLIGDIIIDQLTAQLLGLIGITTTRATPVLDIVGGLLGGETTTTEAPENSGLVETLLGLLFPTTTPATTTTTTTACGGLLGGGLLC